MDSRGFYDDYVEHQVGAGVNARHHAILSWLRRFGLKAGQRVLEVGCGVGTVTSLLTKELGPEGELVSLDLSPRSIETAKEQLGDIEQLTLLAGNVLEVDVEGPFDVLVLPDVIEHIPLEHHEKLFARLAHWLSEDGFILLHYPNPLYLDWVREFHPEQLQPVDQAISADVLTRNAGAQGLYLDYLKTYSIWIQEGDYVVAVLRPLQEGLSFKPVTAVRRPAWRRIAGRFLRALR